MPDSNSRPPTLSPHYRPAVADSMLAIRFVGNTAAIMDAKLGAVDPYQMLAAGEWLKMKAFQMIQSAEIAEARRLEAEEIEAQRQADLNRIAVTDKLPPAGYRGPETLKQP